MKAETKERNKKYYEEHKERLNDMNRWRIIKHKYGLTKEQWMGIFDLQGGACALCNTHQSELTKALCTDHDHETGKVRGLLCLMCNSALARLGDNKASIKKVLRYVS